MVAGEVSGPKKRGREPGMPKLPRIGRKRGTPNHAISPEETERRILSRGNDFPQPMGPNDGAAVCGARTRTGRACKRRRLLKGNRCVNHGGASSGPRSAAGRAKIAAAQKERWRAWREAASRDAV